MFDSPEKLAVELEMLLEFDPIVYSKDLFKQFLYKFYAQIRHEIYMKLAEFRLQNASKKGSQQSARAGGNGGKTLRSDIDGLFKKSFSNDSMSETNMLSEEAFLQLAQSLDMDVIRVRVQKLLGIIGPAPQ